MGAKVSDIHSLGVGNKRADASRYRRLCGPRPGHDRQRRRRDEACAGAGGLGADSRVGGASGGE